MCTINMPFFLMRVSCCTCISSEIQPREVFGSIPEVASTVVALGSRGWLREAAQVVGVNWMLGKGEGIWGCLFSLFVVLAHFGWGFR